MPRIDIQNGGRILSVFNFEIQNISAKGGPEFPILVIPYELRVHSYTEQSGSNVQVHPVTCIYLTGEFLPFPHQKVAARFQENLAYYSSDPGTYANGNIEIPIDLVSVSRIEEARTGDLVSTLKLRTVMAIHAVAPNHGVQGFAMGESNGGGFAIPKSLWIERILPGLGYGRLELLEVRLSPAIPTDHGLPKAVTELRQARDYLLAGDWDQSISRCRIALETIPDSRPLQLPGKPKFSLRVDTFVSDHIGNRLGSEQAKLLADQMKSLWAVCSAPVHPSPARTFTRADAEFIIRNTMAVIEYVGRLLG